MIPAQCRAARGLLDRTQAQLAEAAGLALATVVKFERSGRAMPAKAVQAMLAPSRVQANIFLRGCARGALENCGAIATYVANFCPADFTGPGYGK